MFDQTDHLLFTRDRRAWDSIANALEPKFDLKRFLGIRRKSFIGFVEFGEKVCHRFFEDGEYRLGQKNSYRIVQEFLPDSKLGRMHVEQCFYDDELGMCHRCGKHLHYFNFQPSRNAYSGNTEETYYGICNDCDDLDHVPVHPYLTET